MAFRRILFLTALALCAISAAAPASASAKAEWTQEGAPLTENASVGLGGSINFFAGIVTIGCGISAGEMEMEAETGTGKISELTFFPCIAQGLPGCQVTAEAAGLPWTVHVTTNARVQITFFTVIYKLEGVGCPPFISISSNEKVNGLPDNKEAITKLSMSGEVTASTEMPGLIGGEVFIQPAEKYGVCAEEE